MNNRTILQNGLVVITNHCEPTDSESIISLWIKTGSSSDPLYKNGLAHFVEHALFELIPKDSQHEYIKDIERIGGQINGNTNKEYTHFFIRVPTEKIEVAFLTLSQIIQNPTWNVDVIEQEKDIIIEEVYKRTNTVTHLKDVANKWLYVGGRLSNNPVGTKDTITTLTIDDLKAFYNEYYVPNNSALICVSNKEHEEIEVLVAKYFGQWKLSNGVFSGDDICDNFPDKKSKMQLKKGKLGFVVLYYPIDTDPSNYHLLELLRIALNQGISSIFGQIIRRKKKLFYSCEVYVVPRKKKSLFIIYAQSTKIEMVARELKNIMQTLNQHIDDNIFYETRLKYEEQFKKDIKDPMKLMRILGRNFIFFNSMPLGVYGGMIIECAYKDFINLCAENFEKREAFQYVFYSKSGLLMKFFSLFRLK